MRRESSGVRPAIRLLSPIFLLPKYSVAGSMSMTKKKGISLFQQAPRAVPPRMQPNSQGRGYTISRLKCLRSHERGHEISSIALEPQHRTQADPEGLIRSR